MAAPHAARLAAITAIACVTALAVAGGRNPPVSTAQLLVDLARDHALSRSGTQTEADVLHVRALLRAAARLDPRLVEAHAWLYELALLGGDTFGAAEVLEKLVAADPEHQGAFLRWLDAGLASMQTVEKRQDWLAATLAASNRPPELQAMVHVAMARLSFEAADRARARMQLDRALGLDRNNPDAAILNLALLDPDAPAIVRLRAALRALQFDPLSAETAWHVGALLDETGYAAEARPFYDHALEVHAATSPGAPVPAELQMQLACNHLARGEGDAALNCARQAAEGDGDSFEARMFYFWLLKRTARDGDAEQVRIDLSRRFAAIRDPREFPPAEVAQAAWYHCLIDPQPQRALMLAEAAAAARRSDPFVQRALGWALALNRRNDEAVRTLLPLASRDAYAAYQLARLAREAGDEQGAIRLIQNLAFLPPAGPAHDLIASLRITRSGASGEAARAEVAELLADFDRDIFDFHRNPAQYLEASIELEDSSPLPGEPWWVELALTNHARFPITLGPDWMLNPVFLLSFRLDGDRAREYPHVLTINLDRVRVIQPEQTVTVRRTIDVGPLRRVTRQSPQVLQRVAVLAILDPVQDPTGQWRPAATGQQLRPGYFNRLPARVGSAELAALFAAGNSDDDRERFRAIEVLAELLGERQRADLKRLSYNPEPIPTDRVYQALQAGLRSDSWEFRVRTLEALQVVGLDAQMLNGVQSCLTHPHWCVRLMATRLIARQGAAVLSQMQRIAEDDEDDLVSDIAKSYARMWAAPPASQPTADAP